MGAQSFRSSLACELVKETFAVLDKLSVKEVASALSEEARMRCLKAVVGFVMRFDECVASSQNNSGLPGASGKVSASDLQPVLRSLVLFTTFKTTGDSSEDAMLATASELQCLGPLIARNDPAIVHAVLSVFAAFVQSCARLPPEESNRLYTPFPAGPRSSAFGAAWGISDSARVPRDSASMLCIFCVLSLHFLRCLAACCQPL